MKHASVRTFFSLFALLLAAILSVATIGNATAANTDGRTLVVSTGAPKGTYSTMQNQLTSVCSASVPATINERHASGSLESLARLLDNETHLIWVQADVLAYREKLDDLKRVRTLLVLYPEEAHFIARTPQAPGWVQAQWQQLTGQRATPLATVADLAGRRVAAFGGGVVTAHVISARSDLGLQVKEVAGHSEALAALNKGEVDAVLAVGGAPLPWVRDLGSAYRLLAVPAGMAKRLDAVYRPARIRYPQLSAEPVPTVATEALLLTQDFRGAATRQALIALRNCTREHIDALRETAGFHPHWWNVNADSTPAWAPFDADGAKAAQRPAAAAPAAATTAHRR